METMDRYLELTENGSERSEYRGRPRVHRTLELLLRYARERGGLELEGAWRLQSSVARELTETFGYTPAGGWGGVASLAAGTRIFSAGRDRFEARIEREELAEWNESRATRSLLEAFTRRLVPPATAAGLFILLGVHPAWGVHIAHRAHRRFGAEAPSGDGSGEERDSELFPEGVCEVVSDAVFDVVAVLMALFRRLDSDRVYPVDALSGFVDALCSQIRARSRSEAAEIPEGALPPFVSLDRRSSNWRVIDFTTADLVDAFLIPAGVAHRRDDGTFRVHPGAFEGARAGGAAPPEQDERLTQILCGGSGSRVA